MTEQPAPAPQPQVSEEFFIRVNDFLAMANRIERRLDTPHAQLVLLHAMARYSAHHYRSTARNDDAQNRNEFASYTGAAVSALILSNLDELAGPAPVAKPDDAAAE